MESLPTPPHEEHAKSSSSRKGSNGLKPVKTANRISKRASNSHAHPPSPSTDSHSHHSVADGRHKRVWKACERCRMKKTKCDGEFPCKRCKDDGLVCTAGTRKKTEYKQLPRGYAEVLENTQFALIATVHKLYSMVRNGQQWDLGEPELNDRGQPIIHNIASRLGCIRPNSDIDLPPHSVFPENEADLVELSRQLEEHQHEREAGSQATQSSSTSSRQDLDTSSTPSSRTDRASSSELDHSDFEMEPPQDYRKVLSQQTRPQLTMSMSPQAYPDFATPTSAVSTNSPSMRASFDSWLSAAAAQPSSTAVNFSQLPPQQDPTANNPFLAAMGAAMDMDLLNQGLFESNFGTIKPHVLSCANPEAMMGLGDPMIYSGYDPEKLRTF